MAITRAIKDKGDTIRLPIHLIDKASEVENAEFALASKLGERPSDEQLAVAVGLDVEKLHKLRALAASTLTPPSSLESPIHGEGRMLIETIPGAYSLNPYEYCGRQDMIRFTNGAVEKLSLNRSDILKKRFGLNGEQELTFKEVAAQRGCSIPNVDRIQRDALKAFEPSDLEEFRLFLTA